MYCIKINSDSYLSKNSKDKSYEMARRGEGYPALFSSLKEAIKTKKHLEKKNSGVNFRVRLHTCNDDVKKQWIDLGDGQIIHESLKDDNGKEKRLFLFKKKPFSDNK